MALFSYLFNDPNRDATAFYFTLGDYDARVIALLLAEQFSEKPLRSHHPHESE